MKNVNENVNTSSKLPLTKGKFFKWDLHYFYAPVQAGKIHLQRYLKRPLSKK